MLRRKVSVLSSSHALDSDGIHVGIILILSTHGPAESIVAGTAPGMNRPAGRHRDLAVPHDERPQLLRLTHEMHHHRITGQRSEEHTSELQSPCNLVCRLLLEKKKPTTE